LLPQTRPHIIGRMRFATFNVLHGQPIKNGRLLPVPAGGAAAEPLAEAVASLDADVLAVQEVDRLQERSGRVDQALVAARTLHAKDWRYATALHGRSVPGTGWVPDPAAPRLRVYGPEDAAAVGDLPSHGIALLTRFPARGWRASRLAAGPLRLPLLVPGRPGLTVVQDQPRAALAAVLEGERGPFTVAAVHLSFVPGWNIGQLVTVRNWIADLPRPHLLLGDFNMIGAVARAVLAGAEVLGQLNSQVPPHRWRDLARAPTYPSHSPLVQIDHILAAGVSSDTVGAVSTPATPISDHRPMVAELAL
jgi:endonuclease/exonuclease/phosphatase family metal-dependent hydrolase